MIIFSIKWCKRGVFLPCHRSRLSDSNGASSPNSIVYGASIASGTVFDPSGAVASDARMSTGRAEGPGWGSRRRWLCASWLLRGRVRTDEEGDGHEERVDPEVDGGLAAAAGEAAQLAVVHHRHRQREEAAEREHGYLNVGLAVLVLRDRVFRGVLLVQLPVLQHCVIDLLRLDARLGARQLLLGHLVLGPEVLRAAAAAASAALAAAAAFRRRRWHGGGGVGMASAEKGACGHDAPGAAGRR